MKDPIHKTKSGTDLVELGALMAQLSCFWADLCFGGE